jgi:hypothetical protein
VPLTLLEQALVEIVAALESLQIDYMVVGGIANAIWGEPRATVDIDVTVAVEEPRIPQTAMALGRGFRLLVDAAPQFIRETRVLPLETSGGVRVDVIFALVSFELQALRRARDVEVAGRRVRVVSPEDLILMKIISERPQDIADAEALIARRRPDLDVTYLEPRIRALSADLERPEILTRWKAAIQRDP